jgi:3-oxoacyl-[acyl-carrier protein] reductase
MKNEIVLITGAGQGIGKAITLALAAPERTLILVDLNMRNLVDLATQMRTKCREVITIDGDLTSPSVQAELTTSVLGKFDHIDVLINNAGVSHKPKLLEEITDEEYEHNFAVNTHVPFRLMKAFLPSMKAKKHGLIINMSSAANISGYADLSVYSATKSALSSLTDSVAKETKDFGIKAIAIMPSRTNTAMQEFVRGKEVAAESQSPEYVAEVISKIVSGEIPTHSGDNIRIRDGKFLVEQDITTQPF